MDGDQSVYFVTGEASRAQTFSLGVKCLRQDLDALNLRLGMLDTAIKKRFSYETEFCGLYAGERYEDVAPELLAQEFSSDQGRRI